MSPPSASPASPEEFRADGRLGGPGTVVQEFPNYKCPTVQTHLHQDHSIFNRM